MAASTFTTSDLSRKSGDIIAEALRRPVTITQRNKPRLVLMSIADFERLRDAAELREARFTSDMPSELADAVVEEFKRYMSTSET